MNFSAFHPLVSSDFNQNRNCPHIETGSCRPTKWGLQSVVKNIVENPTLTIWCFWMMENHNDVTGEAYQISSPGWAGAYPWIKTNGIVLHYYGELPLFLVW